MMAQRVAEDHGSVIYEDGRGALENLGLGFNPLLTADGKLIFIRGRRFRSGDHFDCGKKNAKNWIAEYDPTTKSKGVLFDRALSFDYHPGMLFCIFDQMQVSPDSEILYLVSPVYATSGSLATIHLKTGHVTYIGGVNEAFVIQSGPEKGDLIYQRRLWSSPGLDGHPYYPWIHARADGNPIKVLQEEPFTIGGSPRTDAPQLVKYLLSINGTIEVDGKTFP